MKEVCALLDSTYLKTAQQAGIEESENQKIVNNVVQEAIDFGFKLVMIRSEYVQEAKQMIQQQSSNLLVGTVIDFSKGCSSVDDKINMASEAMRFGTDELDFVINYEAFKNNDLDTVKAEVERCTSLCLKKQKVVKWIIEIAALSDQQIASITQLIRDVVEKNFVKDVMNVFVKSSTGFYVRNDGGPVGATVDGIKIMSMNSGLLPLKAAGGVRTLLDVQKMVSLGVSRIGTSSARQIIQGKKVKTKY
ncbi:MAG: deoxyribose-phosphate aldolase [Flavobacteriales bacterium]|nr:deoxyribose-phosphate aldolase [Flavobacteriales bacterium]|tara:strand:+ start:1902 stop:2645 length:744 start_codon:yes stop_codon:yes gene_type:complete